MARGDVGVFDRFARLYDLCMPSARGEPLRRAIARADRPVERVLDVAGGSGRGVRALSIERATVVDAAPRMIGRARAHGVEGAVGDATRLPVRGESVDAVLIVDALHHVEDTGAVIGEAARVLRRGGVLVVREFDPTTLRGRVLVAAEHAVGFDSQFFPPDDLAGRVGKAGLEPVVTDRGFGYTVAGIKPSEEARGARVG